MAGWAGPCLSRACALELILSEVSLASFPDSLALVLSGARMTIPVSCMEIVIRAPDKTSKRESENEAKVSLRRSYCV